MRHRWYWLGLTWLLIGPGIGLAAPATGLHLATLEWRPYVAVALPSAGLSSTIVSNAAALIGRRLQLDYFPWVRAMKMGGEDPAFDGYFPSYYVEQRSRRCYFSDPIGTSTIGLAYLKGVPIAWHRLDDLRAYRIGVVLGYSNGKEFDRLVSENQLSVEFSSNDLSNIRKLIAGRTQAIVIDQTVLRYLLVTEPSLAPQAAQIVFHSKPIAELSLHVCFRHTASGKALQTAFDQALKKLDVRRIETDYFEQLDGMNK